MFYALLRTSFPNEVNEVSGTPGEPVRKEENAAYLAFHGDDDHIESLAAVTMRPTGEGAHSQHKEIRLGGVAINIAER